MQGEKNLKIRTRIEYPLELMNFFYPLKALFLKMAHSLYILLIKIRKNKFKKESQ